MKIYIISTVYKAENINYKCHKVYYRTYTVLFDDSFINFSSFINIEINFFRNKLDSNKFSECYFFIFYEGKQNFEPLFMCVRA